MSPVWRRYRWRILSGLGGAVGVGIVLVLLVPAPSITFPPNPRLLQNPDSLVGVSREPTTYLCFGSFDLPPVDEERWDDRDTDAELNGVFPTSSPEAALVYDNFCERLRSQRVSSAVLVAIPTVLLLSVALLARGRPDEEDYR